MIHKWRIDYLLFAGRQKPVLKQIDIKAPTAQDAVFILKTNYPDSHSVRRQVRRVRLVVPGDTKAIEKG